MTTASPGAFPAPPLRPGWWPVISSVFLGYVLAAFVLFALALAAVLLGLADWNGGVPSESALRGPYAADGAWSVAANAAVAFTVVAVAAWAVTRVLVDRVHERVSLPLVLAALAVTGYAPYLALEGRLRLSGVVGLLVAAALIRWQAVGETPVALALATARACLVEKGLWRGIVLTGAAAWAAAAAVAAAYGLLHPLSGGYAVDYAPSNYSYSRSGGEQVYVFRGPPGTEAPYTIDIRNAGFAGLTVLAVDVPAGSGFTLSGFTLADSPHTTPAGRAVDGRDSVFLGLDLRLAGCEGAGLSVLRDVRVHYRVLGRSESQRVALEPAPAVRCSELHRVQ